MQTPRMASMQQVQQMQPRQMQLQSLPPSNSSSSGSWFGMNSGRQQHQVSPRSLVNPSGGVPDNYAIGGRRNVGYYDAGLMQKASHVTSNYGGPAVMSGQAAPNGFVTNGMVNKAFYPNDVPLESAGPLQHLPMSSGARTMQATNMNGDLYYDHRMAGGGRPMYSQQFDPCAPPGHGQMVEAIDGVRSPPIGPGIPMGSDMNPDALVSRMTGESGMRASMHPQRTLGGYSQQRVVPYPNPQQYMQNKRAQYNAQQKMYSVDPSMQPYGCYGSGWPRQPVAHHHQQQQQQTMVVPGYPGVDVPCHVKDEKDLYLQMGVPHSNQCQPQPWHQSPLTREPVQRTNVCSPPPGNPTPPMTPGSSIPCLTPFESAEMRMNGLRLPIRESEPHFTFSIPDGMIKPPFQLEHNLPVSCHIFNLHDQMHESLMSRHDLDLMLKCYHKDDRTTMTNWPATVSISLNEVPLVIDRGNTVTSHHQPMFLKSVCKPGQNSLQISVKACSCSHFFVLQIVERPTVRSILQGLLSKCLLPISQGVSKIKRVMSQMSMTSPGGVLNDLPVLQLTCPISMRRIVLPSRGRDCRHIQCFDLESYLKINCERSQWICPICKKFAALDGLEVDHYIWGVLCHLSNTFFDSVVFDISVSWKPHPKPGVDYGNDTILCKKFTSINSTVLPNPSTFLTNKISTNNHLTSSGVHFGSTKEIGLQDRHQKLLSNEPPNYLGCLSQMTDVFLGPESSPNMSHQTNAPVEHVSFPPTPMGSQISQICTPLDGQSLHPRTPSDGHVTHPHTPPDGHPFTPIDSQSNHAKTPSESYGSAGGTPRTPSAAYDCGGGGKQGTSIGIVDGCAGNSMPSSISGSTTGQLDVGKMQIPGVRDQPNEPCVDRVESPVTTTTDPTKLDFKSDLGFGPLLDLNDDDTDMFSWAPDVFDDDPSDLTSYLGPKTKMAANQPSTLNKDVDEDFLSLLM